MAELYVNVNGTWKTASNYYINVNGTWKEGSELHAKVSSAWKESGGGYGGTSGIVTTNIVLDLNASNSSSYGGSGTTWSNLASSSLNATLVNGVTFSSDNGGTFVFDGTNDYAEITSASALGGFSGDFTIEFWYKASDQGGYDTLFDFNGQSSSTGLLWAVQSANPTGSNMAFRRDGTFAITTSGIDAFDDNWHHHVVARNGSTITYYIDNVSRGTVTYSSSISSGTHLKIGGYSIAGGYEIAGSLPQLRIYDGTGFTASQVLQNYNATKSQYLGLITTNLVLHLDASNSSSYSGSGTTWTDLSSNSNDGTLTNGPTYSADNGGAIVFDGTDDYVSLGTSINSDISQHKDCSFNIWVKLDDDSNDHIIFTTDESMANWNNAPIVLWYDQSAYSTDNTGTGDVGGQSTKVLTVMITDTSAEKRYTTSNNVFGDNAVDTWHNICVVLDPSNDKFYTYVNGVENALYNSSALNGIKSTSTDFRIGYGTSSNALDGKVAQLQVYDVALTANQVLQNYNATKATYGY
jgi:hypothetical protein